MKIFPWAVIASLFLASPGYAETHVNGYYRSNGTYVAPHYRSSPDSSYNNNWSTSPNVNPHTGRVGTNEPRYEPYDSTGDRPNSGYRSSNSSLRSGSDNRSYGH